MGGGGGGGGDKFRNFADDVRLARPTTNYKEHLKFSIFVKLVKISVFVFRAVVLTTCGSKVVIFSARTTKIYKICKLCTEPFSASYNISRQTL